MNAVATHKAPWKLPSAGGIMYLHIIKEHCAPLWSRRSAFHLIISDCKGFTTDSASNEAAKSFKLAAQDTRRVLETSCQCLYPPFSSAWVSLAFLSFDFLSLLSPYCMYGLVVGENKVEEDEDVHG